MITGITLENFKAFKERQVVPIKPITLIFGPNSGGKSCIFRALATLKHVFETGGDGEPDRVDAGWSSFSLGGWQNLVHGHLDQASFSIGLQRDASCTMLHAANLAVTMTAIPLSETTESKLPEERIWEITRPEKDRPARAASFTLSQGGEALLQCTYGCEAPKKESRAGLIERLKAFAIRKLTERIANEKKRPSTEKEREELQSWLAHAFGTEGIDPLNWLSGAEERVAKAGEVVSDDGLQGNWDEQNRRLGLLVALDSDWDGDSPYRSDLNRIGDLAWVGEIQKRSEAVPQLWKEWCSAHAHLDPAPSADLFSEIWIHLDPVRERPSYRLDFGSIPDDPQAKPWKTMLIDGSMRQRASDALEALTKDDKGEGGYQIDIRTRSTTVSKTGGSSVAETTRTERELCFVRKEDGLSLSPHDLGYGISTILPVVAALTTEKGKLISIEQPELHLHPRMQAELGDLFIDAALGNRGAGDGAAGPNSRFLIETHSEHLILRLLRRIRETTEGDFDDWPEALREACPGGIRPSDVAVLYVEPGEEGATIKQLRINELGEFVDEWPQGFFEERVREVL